MIKHYVYIFRHGQTEFNKKGIFTGWLDSKLTPLGIKQARIVAKKLKNKKIQIAFQTKLSRSKDSLKKVLKYHPECKRIITDNRIIERNYGKLNGVSHKEFIGKVGKQEYDLIHRGYDIPPPGGESFKDVEKRVGSFIRYLKKFIRKEKVNVVISAHGNSIRLFRKILEKKSKEECVKWFIPYTKVFVYEV